MGMCNFFGGLSGGVESQCCRQEDIGMGFPVFGRYVYSFGLSLVLCSSLGICQKTLAEDASQSTQAAQGNAPSSADGGQAGSDNSTGNTGLKGGVQKVELSLEKLRDVGLDLKELLKGLSSLYDEVTAQPVQLITEPEIVGRGIVINIPVGTMPVGPRPPARKKRVDIAMGQIAPVVTMMKENVDEVVAGKRELDLPSDVIETLQPQFKAWTKAVDATAGQLSQLQQLTQGPPYDNDAIAQTAAAMEKNVKTLDETRRAIYKVIRKEGRRIAASSS